MKFGEGYKVLIVDDEHIIRERLKLNVIKSGFEVAGEAGNGTQALDLFKKTKPDIVISDIFMPAMNGTEFLEAVRRNDSRVKFIFLTGYSEFDYAMSALKNNASDYLLKPLDSGKLMDVLEKIVREIEEQKELESVKRENLLIREGGYIEQFFSSGEINPDMNRDLASILLDPDGTGILMIYGRIDWRIRKEMIYPIESDISLLFYRKNGVDPDEFCSTAFYAAMDVPCYSGKELKDSYLNLRRILLSRFFRPRIHFYQNEKLHRADKGFLQTMDLQNRRLFQSNRAQGILELIEIQISKLKTPADLEYYVYLIKGLVLSKSDKLETSMLNDHSPIWILEQFSSLTDFICWLKSLIGKTLAVDGSLCELDLSDRVKRFLDENYSSSINLDKIALNVFAHPNYISTRFKEEEGVSVTEYLCSLRLDRARELLETTNLSCKKISGMVGFQDPMYFGKCYKKKYGITPTASQRVGVNSI